MRWGSGYGWWGAYLEVETVTLVPRRVLSQLKLVEQGLAVIEVRDREEVGRLDQVVPVDRLGPPALGNSNSQY